MEQSYSTIKAIFGALDTTPNAFALSHGFSVPSMYGFANGTRNLGYDTLVSMCKAEPRISAEYLLRGEGEPLRDRRQTIDLTTAEELRAFKAEMVQALDKRIQELGG